MHVGPVDRAAVERFAAADGGVRATQIQPLAQVDGASITFTRADGSSGTMGDSLLDNYFDQQNPSFDFLLDTTNAVVHPGPGEIGVPVAVLERYGLAVGDSVRVVHEVGGGAASYTIAYGVRDAQMGSSMASSTRFLVSETDYAAVAAGTDRHESIIAFLLDDPGRAADFQTRWSAEAAGMPTNGQGITGDLIRLVDALGDGLMSGVLIGVSLVLILIAMLNVRFTLLATLAEEVREIGTLKAIGLSDRDIRGLYQAKYLVIAGAAALLAAACALPLAGLFTQNIALNFGLSEATALTWLLPFAAVAVVFAVVALLLRRILRRVARLSIVEALTTAGTEPDGRRRRALPRLATWFGRRPDLALSLHGLRADPRAWSLPVVVFLLTTLTILIPLNLLTTLDSPRFVRYLGSATSDVRIDLQHRPDLATTAAALRTRLAADPAVARSSGFTTYRTQVAGETGWQAFLVESGDYRDFAIEVSDGVLPTSPSEIALSALNAERLGLTVGDTLPVRWDGREHPLRVVGVYQDITNGGLTAKTAAPALGDDIVGYTFFLTLADADPAVFAAAYHGAFPDAKVIPMESFREQTLGTITASLSLAVRAVVVLAVAVAGLIALLFVKLQLQRNRGDDAALRALGYRVRSVRGLYVRRAGLTAALGVLVGAGLALTLGQGLVGGLFGALGIGITSLTLTYHPLLLLLCGVALPLAVGLAAAWRATGDVARTSVLNLGHA